MVVTVVAPDPLAVGHRVRHLRQPVALGGGARRTRGIRGARTVVAARVLRAVLQVGLDLLQQIVPGDALLARHVAEAGAALERGAEIGRAHVQQLGDVRHRSGRASGRRRSSCWSRWRAHGFLRGGREGCALRRIGARPQACRRCTLLTGDWQLARIVRSPAGRSRGGQEVRGRRRRPDRRSGRRTGSHRGRCLPGPGSRAAAAAESGHLTGRVEPGQRSPSSQHAGRQVGLQPTERLAGEVRTPHRDERPRRPGRAAGAAATTRIRRSPRYRRAPAVAAICGSLPRPVRLVVARDRSARLGGVDQVLADQRVHLRDEFGDGRARRGNRRPCPGTPAPAAVFPPARAAAAAVTILR